MRVKLVVLVLVVILLGSCATYSGVEGNSDDLATIMVSAEVVVRTIDGQRARWSDEVVMVPPGRYVMVLDFRHDGTLFSRYEIRKTLKRGNAYEFLAGDGIVILSLKEE